MMSSNLNEMIHINRKSAAPSTPLSFITDPTPTSACYIKTNEIKKRRNDKHNCEPVC